jgi:hypothetical protein
MSFGRPKNVEVNQRKALGVAKQSEMGFIRDKNGG